MEDAGTLEGNARLKAVALCDATGLPAVADDTGLFVDALDGEPGVDAAYYAGDGHLRREPHQAARGARRRRRSSGRLRDGGDRGVARRAELCVEGVCPGVIATEERGAVGFGYDSVFQPDEGDGATFAEMGADAKNEISIAGVRSGHCSGRWRNGDDEAPVITAGDLEVGHLGRHEASGGRARGRDERRRARSDRSAMMPRTPGRGRCARRRGPHRAARGSRDASTKR